VKPAKHSHERKVYGLARMVLGYATWLTRYHRAILWISFSSFIVAGYFSVKLYQDLRTDLEELLPETAQSVRDVRSAVRRIGGLNHLSIVLETTDSAAAIRLSNDIAAELKKLPPELVARVQNSISAEKSFFEKYKALYVDLDDWKRLDQYVRDRIRYERKGKSPFSLGLEDESQAPSFDFEGLRKKYEERAGAYSRFPGGYFQSRDGRHTVVLAFLPGKVTDQQANQKLSAAAHTIVEKLAPKTYAPDMIVGFNGDVQNMVEEHEGLTEDLISSSIIVTILCALVLYLYFRSFWAVYALCAALFAGVAWTFGLSYGIVGYLNANTAFMGAIVVGNGINFGIIMAARYFELRRQMVTGSALIARSIAYTAQSTWTAAAAAGAAYLSLVLTDFRGFNQFGLIGGMGMVLCWISSFLVLPAMLHWFNHRGWLGRTDLKQRSYFAAASAAVVERAARPVAVLTLISLIGGAVVLTRFSSDMLESDFSKLRNKRSLETGAGFWGKKVDGVFERYLTPTLVASADPTETSAIVRELRAAHETLGTRSPISEIRVVEDFLPKNQSEKIKVIEAIRKQLSPRVLKAVSKKDRELIQEFIPDVVPAPLAVKDLPEALITHFRELDGTIGRLVHVYPRLQQGNFWDGKEVIRFAEVIRKAVADAKVGAIIAGQPPLSADMITSISKDGPKATLFAFAAVLVLVLVIFPRVGVATQVIGALLLGVTWMVAVMVLRGYKINFLNFIALPITFGIGVDYAVNVYSRYRQDGSRAIVSAIRHTGGAVVLCSLTTIIGYGSLLIAGSQAFVSFGELAVLGELTCLVAAMIAVPSLLAVFEKRKKAKLQSNAAL